ncbi:MAG: AAA family ATPase [Actinomycetia bacterium]|nr:AAA family ATPase [Actinomycetes bacterium]
MAMLTVRLLGAMVLELDGQRVAAPASRRAQDLLAILLLNPGPSSRSTLIHTLWPDLPEEARGRKQLSQELWRLRNTLEKVGADDLIEFSNQLLGLRRASENGTCQLETDVELFTEMVAAAGAARRGSAAEHDALELAASLYGGDLLDGVFDDWLMAPRRNYKDMALGVFDRLVELRTARGAYDEARPMAHRLVALDPLSEESHRRLMRLEMLNGRPNAALAAWDACCEILDQELNIEPDLETLALRDEIVSSRQGGSDPLHHRAASATMVGRASERASLIAVADDLTVGTGRFVLVEGDAGTGKTRLLDEFANDAEWRGIRIARALAVEGDLATLVAAIRSVLSPIDARRLRTRVSERLQESLIGLFPELADMEDLVADPKHLGSQNPATGSDADRAALIQTIAVLSESQPLAIILDEAGAIDDPSIDLVFELARSIDTKRLAIVLAYRHKEIHQRPATWSAVRSLDALDSSRRLSLGPLTTNDLEQLVAATLPTTRQAKLASELEEATGGNPYLATQTLGLLRDLGQDRIPDTIDAGIWERFRDHLDRRIEDLTPNSRLVFELLAVSGDALAIDAIEDIVGLGGGEILDALDELETNQLGRVLTERSPSNAAALVHRVLAATVYDAMSNDHRSQMHRKIAATLIDRGEAASRVAVHLTSSAQPAAAFGWWVTAAESARRQGVLHEAVDAVDRALECASDSDDDRLDQLLMELQRCAEVRRDLPLSERLLTLLDARFGPAATLELADRRIAHLARSGKVDDAKLTVLAALESTDDSEIRARVLAAAARTHMLGGSVAAAAATLRDAWAETPTEPDTRMVLLDAEAAQLLTFDIGNPRIHVAAEEGALIATEAGRYESAFRFRAMAAASLLSEEPERGTEMLAAIVTEAGANSMFGSVVDAANSHCEALATVGLRGAAITGFEQTIARSESEPILDLNVAESRRILASQLAELTGDAERVEALVAESMPILRNGTAPDIAPGTEAGPRALIAMNNGDLDKADRLLSEYDRALRRHHSDHRRPEPVLWHARLLTAMGEFEQALSVLDRLPRSQLGDRRRAGAMRADLLVRLGREEAASQMILGLMLRPAFGSYPELELASLRLAEAQGRQGDAEAALDRAWSSVIRTFEPFNPLIDCVAPSATTAEIVRRVTDRRRAKPRLKVVDQKGREHRVEVSTGPHTDIAARRLAVADALRSASTLGVELTASQLAPLLGVSESTARRDITLVRRS